METPYQCAGTVIYFDTCYVFAYYLLFRSACNTLKRLQNGLQVLFL